jgi:hypothetical protein
VVSTEERIISSEQRTLIEPLRCERISLRGICRAVGVSLTWLLHCMVERFAACPDPLHAQLPVNPTDVVLRRLEAEVDEIWSFVHKKAHKPWIWMAMDAKTRQIMAFHVGDRSRDSAKQLWAKIPIEYREQVIFHPDHIPSDLVEDQWVSNVESSSPRDVLLLHDLWTTFRHLLWSQITSAISTAWDFTTKSGGIWEQPLCAHGVIVTYEAIRQWCRKFGQQYANQLRRRRPRPGEPWIKTAMSSISWSNVGGTSTRPRNSSASCSRAASMCLG